MTLSPTHIVYNMKWSSAVETSEGAHDIRPKRHAIFFFFSLTIVMHWILPCGNIYVKFIIYY